MANLFIDIKIINILSNIGYFLVNGRTRDNTGYIILGLFILISIFDVILIPILNFYGKKKVKRQIKELSNNELVLTPREFLKLRRSSFGGRGLPYYALKYNFPGVYILYNETKNMYYVGQGKQVLNRVNAHFTGRGNGDVYPDYKYGDEFTIRIISLENSGYRSLNKLEKDTIMTYNAYAKGYNKTRGNI